MEKWRNKVAVVTGASSGIGEAIALELVKHGLNVVGIARRTDRLEELKIKSSGPGELRTFQADVGNEDDIAAAFQFVKQTFGTLHILVNNAGVARPGPISSQDSKYMKEVLDINVIGLTLCTQQALALMKETGIDDGHIINMNSVLGHKLDYFTDFTAMYGPSKHAVTALSEVFRRELRITKRKIRVTSISPGQVDTEILDSSRKAVGLEPRTSADETPVGLLSQDIAGAVIFVLSCPSHVQVHEMIMKHIDEKF